MDDLGQSDRCSTCAIRHRAVCGALKADEIGALGRIGKFKHYEAGETILAYDMPSTFFGNIVSGVVKVEKTSADGRQQIVGLLFAPDFLGRAYSKSNPYFAIAASEVVICRFAKTEFEALLHTYSDLEHRLFERTLDELDAAREWMFLLGRKSAQEKVASLLHMIAKRRAQVGCSHAADAAGGHFTLPLTRADMADFLGLTVETVSRQMSLLKKERVISIANGRDIGIADPQALADLAGIEEPLNSEVSARTGRA